MAARVRPSRSAGGQRRYTRNEITVVQYVVELAGEGMTAKLILWRLGLTRRMGRSLGAAWPAERPLGELARGAR
jgi:MerR family transcriptional regulator, heat shock protein HspR